ncbi:MAG: hypothetical protein ACTSWY_13535 [Promethearchaeota archaeon]
MQQRCSNCGAILTRSMKFCCERCGKPIPKEKKAFNDELLQKLATEKSVTWESNDQKDWVLTKCRLMGVDSNHPTFLKRFKNEYNKKFG